MTILLIIDFTIGLTLVYQYNQGNLGNVDPNICEEGRLFEPWGYKWNNFPITYHLDSTIPTKFVNIMIESFEIWDDITNENIFQQVDSSGQSTLDVMFLETSGPFVLGETRIFDPTPGIISYSTLNLSPSKDWQILDFSCKLMPINHPGPYHIKSVMVHELGHVLGLDHTRDEFTTMHDYYIGTFQRTLSQGEIDGFHSIYGF